MQPGITREEFQAYENVRVSGATNMYHTQYVEELSGLERDQIITIMENYAELVEFYPGVRKGNEEAV